MQVDVAVTRALVQQPATWVKEAAAAEKFELKTRECGLLRASSPVYAVPVRTAPQTQQGHRQDAHAGRPHLCCEAWARERGAAGRALRDCALRVSAQTASGPLKLQKSRKMLTATASCGLAGQLPRGEPSHCWVSVHASPLGCRQRACTSAGVAIRRARGGVRLQFGTAGRAQEGWVRSGGSAPRSLRGV